MANKIYSDAYGLSENGLEHIGNSAAVAHRGQSVIQLPVISTTASLAANDVIHVLPLPAGARVSKLVVTNTDLDSGTSAIVCKIGLTHEDDAFGSSLTYLQGAATNAITDAVLQAADAAQSGDELIITITTTATTPAAGTVKVLVEYFMP